MVIQGAKNHQICIDGFNEDNMNYRMKLPIIRQLKLSYHRSKHKLFTGKGSTHLQSEQQFVFVTNLYRQFLVGSNTSWLVEQVTSCQC